MNTTQRREQRHRTDEVAHTSRTVTIIAVLCLGPFALAGQNQDELQRRILAQAQSISADDYAFTRTTRIKKTSNGKTEQKVSVEKFDPTKQGDARWTLVSVDGAPPSADALNDFRKGSAKRRVPGYYRLAGYFGLPATLSTDSQGRAVFHFTPLPKDTVIVLGTEASQNATAEATVSESNGVPFAEEVRTTVRPMRLKLVMKLERFELRSRYRLGPEGNPLLLEQTSDISGSGMGMEGEVHSAITYDDYRAVGGHK